MASLNRLREVLSSVVNTRDDISVAFGVGSPKDNNFIEVVFCLEGTVMKDVSDIL